MTTIDIVLAGAAAGSAGGLWLWIRQDGLIRTAAAYVAIFHRDPVRRRDARRVLGDTRYLRGREPAPPSDSEPQPPPKRRRARGIPATPPDGPDAEA